MLDSVQLQAAVEGFVQRIATVAPRGLAALALLLSLWVVAWLLRALTRRLLKMTKLDALVGPTRVGKVLAALGEDLTASETVARLVYFAVLLLAFTAAAEAVGLRAVGEILSAVLGYLPRILAAILIVAVGGYFASAVGNAVLGMLKAVRSPFARPLAGAAEGGILLVVITLAIDKLGVDLGFVNANLTLIVAAVTLTVCFLFSWAMRRPAEEIVANYYLRRLVDIGDYVKLGDVEGTVERFAPIGVLVRLATGEVQLVPAHHVLDGLRRKGTTGGTTRS
ncbi:MAG: mechanosensitive ion channel domain-containing protein [Myxococcota bacterium]